MASFYSDDYHGRKTAYGDIYNKNQYTCAHKVHPYGSLLKVTRLDNNRSVRVKVIDKGPFIKGRIVDLSRAAAAALDLIKDGEARVKVEVVKRGKPGVAEREQEKPKARTADPRPARVAEQEEDKRNAIRDAPESYENRNQLPERPLLSEPSENNQARQSPPAITNPVATPARPVAQPEAMPSQGRVGEDYQKYGLYKISLNRVPAEGFGVQVISLTDYQNVLKHIADLQAQWFKDIMINVEPGNDKPIYKIILGPFETREQADAYKDNMKRKYNINGFVVSLEEAAPGG